jgi:hypothetical protein
MNNPSPPAAKGLPRDPAKERHWRVVLKQFAASGPGIREFCAARRLKETAFYFWRREIQRRDRRAPRRRTSRPLSFAKVIFHPPQAAMTGEGLRLVLGHGRELLLPASMPVQHVAALVRAIEGAA